MEKKPILIYHFLENSAKKYPDKIAFIHEKTRATYAEINFKANQLACWLLSRSICKGDRVAIILENSLEYVVSYYGILKAGAVAVPLSTGLKPDGLNPLLFEIEPFAIISSTKFERLLQASDLNLPSLKALIIHNLKFDWSGGFNDVFSFQQTTDNKQPTTNNLPTITHNLQQPTNTQINPSDLSCIIYTSGSTGKPKGVMLSHGNIVSNTHSICQYLKLSHEDIQMVVLPFFYVMGKSLLNTIFAAGGTLVLNNKFAFPAAVINQMIDEKVTIFSGVPSTFAYLLHRSPLEKSRAKLNHLRMVSQAGGHMARSVKEALRQALPEQTQICIMYGATEASARLTWLDPNRFEDKIDSIGKSIPGTKIRIIDKEGREVTAGQKGELAASGPNIMQGYWKDSDATALVLDSNGYHTGDIGHKDEEGFIYLSGRKDDLVKVGGHRINPQEIEDILLATNLIIEAAVFGISDPLLGNKLVALAVAQNGDCTPGDILESCAEKLPKYKLPSRIEFIRALPKNVNGKINRKKCLELLATDTHRGLKYLKRSIGQ